ncbi:Receptor-like serine/threonine-protein kinase SD1-8 [Sesamum alatum]|uniref:non-specific serine/threonine protein kinase n=1 Tax=Sesamum alatum TaxID=300844 RepID=A0AAE1Y2W4_9LAMI|nr:Receptor-like serine/threonine-protein kinase SD1-8 [Sesamum alatum]
MAKQYHHDHVSLREAYEKENPRVGLLGQPSGRKFDYYVTYNPPPPTPWPTTHTGWGHEFDHDDGDDDGNYHDHTAILLLQPYNSLKHHRLKQDPNNVLHPPSHAVAIENGCTHSWRIKDPTTKRSGDRGRLCPFLADQRSDHLALRIKDPITRRRFAITGDTLSRVQSLSGTQTLISKDGIFELGFFTPGSNSSKNTYLGIWYNDFPERTTVWVANRETPLGQDPTLQFAQNGNLVLMFHDSDAVWSTNLMSTLPETVEAVLLDSGNLILRDGVSVFWQSFDHPTDTWLPGAALGLDKITGRAQRLVSWKNADDPSPGMFSVEVSQDHEFEFFLQWNMSTTYWRSGAWNGIVFGSVPEISYLTSFNFVSTENSTYYTYTVLNRAVLSMFVINALGNFEQLTSLRSHYSWSPTYVLPKNQSDIIAFCGAFGVFVGSSSNACTCLHGFAQTRPNDWSAGCSRTTTNPTTPPARNARGCELACRQSCSCTAYAFHGTGCSVWEGDLFDIRNVSSNQDNKQRLYVKVASSDLPIDKGKRKKTLEVIVAVLVSSFVLVSGGFLGCFYTRRTKQKEGKKESGEDLLSFDFNSSVKPNDDGTVLRRRHHTDFDLPMFSYASVSAATDHFSTENKLGEGGFGPVYKGKLLNGQEIALKRLSKKSGQGVEEFRNEILLIAKLQHRNLVRLLGCCINPEESILIYEYMPNKSLDFFLFGSDKETVLDWTTRARIVEGIAQGLLYLHEYSRVRIIHRDLKASNILLDEEMNPKISDFGMARIFGGNDSRTYTKRIVGTFGYMAPEYALQGLFSIKSDVFSFGVLVLEIVSGKRNTGFYLTDTLNLLGHAWELWVSGRGVELMDPAAGCPPASAALRYINVGLLCVQENPNDRPNMSAVISMLSSEQSGPLPAPKQPAFSTTTAVSSAANSSSAGKYSVNGLTVSALQPR